MSVVAQTAVWKLGLEPHRKYVLLAMADHADDDGQGMFPKAKHVARKTGYSVDRVRRIVRELVADTYLVQIAEAHQHRAPEYALGERVWTEAQGGQSNHPAAAQGGPSDGSRVGAGAHPYVEPSVEPPATGEANASPSASERGTDSIRGVTVDRKAVTKAEAELAHGILDAFNQQARTTFTFSGKQNRARTCIVLRIREHPELSLQDHERIIRAELAKPWWQGGPTPQVIYGNTTQFEKCLQRRSRTGAREANPTITNDKVAERTARHLAEIGGGQ